jgi:hypothetical protein
LKGDTRRDEKGEEESRGWLGSVCGVASVLLVTRETARHGYL